MNEEKEQKIVSFYFSGVRKDQGEIEIGTIYIYIYDFRNRKKKKKWNINEGEEEYKVNIILRSIFGQIADKWPRLNTPLCMYIYKYIYIKVYVIGVCIECSLLRFSKSEKWYKKNYKKKIQINRCWRKKNYIPFSDVTRSQVTILCLIYPRASNKREVELTWKKMKKKK